jgi:putative hydrolase of the HAD superfamily
MFPFDVILFDVGGVLLTNGWDRCERSQVMSDFHLDPIEFEKRHREANDPWERDVITAREYLDFTIFHEPRGFTHEDFLEALLAQSVVLEDGGLGILEELAASGNWKLGTLNNEAREPNEHRFSNFGLRQYFDVTFSSCYMGLRKPQPIIYRHALDILGKPAERVLFIDDRMENAAAAAAVGMKSIRFEGAGQLRRELETLGVL